MAISVIEAGISLQPMESISSRNNDPKKGYTESNSLDRNCGPQQIHVRADFFPQGFQLRVRTYNEADEKYKEEGAPERNF